MLEVLSLKAGYGESRVLHDISFTVSKGEILTLLGRNGAGKTTTLRAIMGLVKGSGRIVFKGKELIGLAPEQIARLGIGYVPEERGIFASLSVEENLLLPPIVRQGGMSVTEIYSLFPNLSERRKSLGTHLSGGEQQMLAIGRILRTGAELILLDEPTEGLAPVIIQKISEAVHRLKQLGMTILLVEQNFQFARSIADRHCLVEEGCIADSYLNQDLKDAVVLARLNKNLGL